MTAMRAGRRRAAGAWQIAGIENTIPHWLQDEERN
jgi:hypothetical protein